MASSRDEFTQKTKARLAERAAHHCSNPECRAQTSGAAKGSGNDSINVGQAAHITAAAPGGPRYDPTLTPEERRSPENGIWLCAIHAKKVDDDEHHYTVEQLRKWKREAEDETHRDVGRPAIAPPASGHPAPATRIGRPEHPILPLFTSLVWRGQSVPGRELSLWVQPSPPLEVTIGEARAAVAAGAGCAGWCALPFSMGKDLSEEERSHPQLGTWAGLWAVDMTDATYTNRQDWRSLGLSDRGVLAWQDEVAYGNNTDHLRLTDVVQKVAAFVAFARDVYAEFDLDPDGRLRLHASIAAPRPDLTHVESAPFFGKYPPFEFHVTVTRPRLNARAWFDPNQPEDRLVVSMTHKLVNLLLAECKSTTASFAPKSPPVARIDLTILETYLADKKLISGP